MCDCRYNRTVIVFVFYNTVLLHAEEQCFPGDI